MFTLADCRIRRPVVLGSQYERPPPQAVEAVI